MQSRNFEFLRNARGDLAALGGFAEHYAFNDPASALAKLPLFAERVVGLVYDTFRLPQPYMLSKLSTAGINGQFRTPRHIIKLMVEMLDPKPSEVVGDPACGTAGFLVSAMEYLRRKYSSPELVEIRGYGARHGTPLS